jgi:hypothetical protein
MPLIVAQDSVQLNCCRFRSVWRGFQRLDDITDARNALGPEAKHTMSSYLDSG